LATGSANKDREFAAKRECKGKRTFTGHWTSLEIDPSDAYDQSNEFDHPDKFCNLSFPTVG